MEINVSKIMQDRLDRLNADGTIKIQIEEAVDKTVMGAITSALDSYELRRNIEKQVSDSVSSIAADCGFSAYNGFIAETVKRIVRDLYGADIASKVQKSLNDLMLQKHDGIKLSEIFDLYRKWVCESTEESDKYERQNFCCQLEQNTDGSFTHIICKFADHELDSRRGVYGEKAEIEVRFCIYNGKPETPKEKISSLYLDGHYMKDGFKIGSLTTFETLMANLYYNETEIIMDVDDVDDSDAFDVDI